MNIRIQRWIDRYAGIPICLLLSWFHYLFGILFRRAGGCGKARPRKILVILLSEMGSLVLSHPMFRGIRTRYPEAEVFLLQFHKNRELSLLLNLVDAGHILTIDDRALFRLIPDILRALIKCRTAGIDTVIDCELFARISSILSSLSGAAIRVGFHPHTQEGLYRGGFINRPVLYNPYRHLSEQFITMVDAIDSTASPRSKRPSGQNQLHVPKISIAAEEMEEMETRLKARFGDSGRFKPEVLIYPSGGILPIRAWPPEYYAALCRRLSQDGFLTGIIGLPSDTDLAEGILHQLPKGGCLNLTGFTRNVRELLVLFHLSSLLITNDGGPGQFAALTPIRSIIFFGPETPVLYGAMNGNAALFFSGFPCSPCLTAYNHRNSPCDGDNQCLKSIGVDPVYQKAIELLNTNAPLGRHRFFQDAV